jgi:hypothetical protein
MSTLKLSLKALTLLRVLPLASKKYDAMKTTRAEFAALIAAKYDRQFDEYYLALVRLAQREFKESSAPSAPAKRLFQQMEHKKILMQKLEVAVDLLVEIQPTAILVEKIIARGEVLISPPVITIAEMEVAPVPKKSAVSSKQLSVTAVPLKGCSVCDADYTISTMCASCNKILLHCKRTPGYHPGKFKNDLQCVRAYERHRGNFAAYMKKKKDFKPPVVIPQVMPQPLRDFQLNDLPGEFVTEYTRQMRRIEEFIQNKKKEVHPQNGELSRLVGEIFNLIAAALRSGVMGSIVAIVVTFLAAYSIGALIARNFESHIARVLLGTIGIFAAVAVGNVVGIVAECIFQLAGIILETIGRELDPPRVSQSPSSATTQSRTAQPPLVPPSRGVAPSPSEVFSAKPIPNPFADRAVQGDDISAEPSLGFYLTKEVTQNGVTFTTCPNPQDGEKLIVDLDEATAEPQGWEELVDASNNFVAFLSELFVQGATETTKIVGKHVGLLPTFAATTLIGLRNVAATIRDVKTVVDAAQPLVEAVVGLVYESLFGAPWVPWSERSIIAKINPLLERFNAIRDDPARVIATHADPAYQKKITDLIEDFAKLEDTLTRSKAPPRYVTQIVEARRTLVSWQDLLVAAKKTAHDRIEPFFVEVRGATGVGKSTFMKQLYVDIAPVLHGINERYPDKWNDNMKFTKKMSDTRWDGYKNQPVLELDDFLQRDDVAFRREEVMMLINAVNTAAYPLDMAELTDKGTTFFDSLLIIGSRNGGRRPSNLGIIEPGAYYRRVHLELEMLPESRPQDPKTWKFLFFHPTQGKDVKTSKIGYAEVLGYVTAGLQWNAEVAQRKVQRFTEPVVSVSKDTMAEHRRAIILASRPGSSGKDKKKSAPDVPKYAEGEVVPQGGLFSSESRFEEEITEQLDALFAIKTDLEEWYDDEDALTRLRKFPGRVVDAGNDVWRIFSGKVKYLAHRVVEAVRRLRKLTVQTWDRLQAKFEALATDFGNWWLSLVLSECISAATRTLMEWVSNHKWAIILSAISAAGIVTLGVGALYYFLKDRKDEVALPQSYRKEDERAEKEAAKAEAKLAKTNAKAARKDRGRMRGGRVIYDKNIDEEDPIQIFGQGHVQSVVAPQLEAWEMDGMHSFHRNVYVCFVQKGQAGVTGQIVFLHDRWGVTAKHVARYFVGNTSNVLLTQIYSNGTVTKTNRMALPCPRVIEVENSEIAFVQFDTSLPPQHDIVSHFVKDEDFVVLQNYGVTNPRVLYRDKNGEQVIASSNVGEVRIRKAPLFAGADDNGAPYVISACKTPAASSGGLFMRSDPHAIRRIIGIHVAASTEVSWDAIVTQEMIREFCGEAKKEIIVPQCLIVPGEAIPPKDQAIPVGLLAHGQASGGKNAVTLSPLAPYLFSNPHGELRPTTIPTLMYRQDPAPYAKRWYDAGVLETIPPLPAQVDPLLVAYEGAPEFHHIPLDLLRDAYDASDFPQVEGKRYILLSPEQAVFGCKELGLPGIDLTTSCGYKSRGLASFDRYTMFGVNRNNPTQTPFSAWHPYLREELVRALSALADGARVMFVVVDCLKAERRKPHRVLAGQTRLFYSAHLIHLIISRMFFGHLTMYEKSTRLTGTSAVGISPVSSEWREAVQRLMVHRHLIVTDQPTFDQHNQYQIAHFLGQAHAGHLAHVRLEAPEFAAFWRENIKTPFTKATFLEIVKTLYVASCDSIHVSGNVAYRDAQVTISGVDRTSQLNTYRNKLSIRAVFNAIVRPHLNELPANKAFLDSRALFRLCVGTLLYGDDQVIAIDKDVARFFTPYAYSSVHYELFRSRPTLPSKEPIVENTPFASWAEFELLKRGVAIRDGVFYAPLQKSVIEDCLFWVRSKKSAHANAADTVRSVLLEAAAHGHDYWQRIYRIVQYACREAKVKFEPLSYDVCDQMSTL